MYDLAKITESLVNAGLPVDGVSLSGGVVVVQWQVGVTPTPAQIAQAQAIIDDPLNSTRQKRTIDNIYKDVLALTGPQKTAIWADISVGSPPKYRTSRGNNDASIACMHWSVTYSGAPQASIQAAQATVIAMYTQDNPAYLRNPPFAPSIYISGDESIP